MEQKLVKTVNLGTYRIVLWVVEDSRFYVEVYHNPSGDYEMSNALTKDEAISFFDGVSYDYS